MDTMVTKYHCILRTRARDQRVCLGRRRSRNKPQLWRILREIRLDLIDCIFEFRVAALLFLTSAPQQIVGKDPLLA